MKAEEPHTDNQTKVLEILWYRAQEKQGDVYEAIANTFVQLFLEEAIQDVDPKEYHVVVRRD